MDISNETDSLIIRNSLVLSSPPPPLLLKMLMDDSNWRVPFQLALKIFNESTKYKKNSRHYKVKLNAIRDKFLHDFLEQITIKKIIRNNILVTSLKLYNREPCLFTARWKYMKGRARFATQSTRDMFDKSGIDPYTIHIL